MQIHSDTTQEHTSQFSDNVSRTRSDAGSDRSSGGISAVPATLQNQANSRAHAAHAGSIQRMADNSLQVKKAGILQATADSYSLRSGASRPDPAAFAQKQLFHSLSAAPSTVNKVAVPVQRKVSVNNSEYGSEKEIAFAPRDVFEAWDALKTAVGADEARRQLADTVVYPIDQYVRGGGAGASAQVSGNQQQNANNSAAATTGSSQTASQSQQQPSGIDFFGSRQTAPPQGLPITNANEVIFEWHQHVSSSRPQSNEVHPRLKLIGTNGTHSYVRHPYTWDARQIGRELNITAQALQDLIQRIESEIRSPSSKVRHVPLQ